MSPSDHGHVKNVLAKECGFDRVMIRFHGRKHAIVALKGKTPKRVNWAKVTNVFSEMEAIMLIGFDVFNSKRLLE